MQFLQMHSESPLPVLQALLPLVWQQASPRTVTIITNNNPWQLAGNFLPEGAGTQAADTDPIQPRCLIGSIASLARVTRRKLPVGFLPLSQTASRTLVKKSDPKGEGPRREWGLASPGQGGVTAVARPCQGIVMSRKIQTLPPTEPLRTSALTLQSR